MQVEQEPRGKVRGKLLLSPITGGSIETVNRNARYPQIDYAGLTNGTIKMKEKQPPENISNILGRKNEPRTAQVGAISKAQKQQKDFKVSKYSLLRYRKNPKVEPNWRTRGETLRFFINSVANHQKNWRRGTFGEKIVLKTLTMPKKLKEWTLWDFSTSDQSENSKKIAGGPFGEIFFSKKKPHRAENTVREYPLIPLSFLHDVKILFRKLLKYFKFAN